MQEKLSALEMQIRDNRNNIDVLERNAEEIEFIHIEGIEKIYQDLLVVAEDLKFQNRRLEEEYEELNTMATIEFKEQRQADNRAFERELL